MGNFFPLFALRFNSSSSESNNFLFLGADIFLLANSLMLAFVLSASLDEFNKFFLVSNSSCSFLFVAARCLNSSTSKGSDFLCSPPVGKDLSITAFSSLGEFSTESVRLSPSSAEAIASSFLMYVRFFLTSTETVFLPWELEAFTTPTVFLFNVILRGDEASPLP